MKIRAVVNPVAGTGDFRERWPSIKDSLESSRSEIIFTERKGHAEEIARSSARDGFDCLVVVGGDGTLHEAVQGLALSETALAHIPSGTGSDFARSLSSPSIVSVMEAVKSGSFGQIDLGLVISRNIMCYFLNILEIGFGSVVMQYVNSHRRTPSSFNRGVLASLVKLRPYDLIIESGEFTGKINTIEVVVANGRYFGGGMLASPASSLNDGLVDIHIVDSMGRLALVSRFSSLRDGTYITDPRVKNFSTSSLKISGMAPMEADGENIGDTPAEIRVAHSALKIALVRT